jgi:hypothetical protein
MYPRIPYFGARWNYVGQLEANAVSAPRKNLVTAFRQVSNRAPETVKIVITEIGFEVKVERFCVKIEGSHNYLQAGKELAGSNTSQC